MVWCEMSERTKLKEIAGIFSNAPSDDLKFELLELFFTPNEVEQMIARYEIIQDLVKEELTQREIAARLNISIAKITRGSNELKKRSAPLLRYLSKSINKKGKSK